MKKNDYDSDNKLNNTSSFLKEMDLFDDNHDIPYDVFRVVKVAVKEERGWNGYYNNNIVFSISESKISVRERDFLNTLEGSRLLLDCIKRKINTTSKIKSEIKLALNKIA